MRNSVYVVSKTLKQSLRTKRKLTLCFSDHCKNNGSALSGLGPITGMFSVQ